MSGPVRRVASLLASLLLVSVAVAGALAGLAVLRNENPGRIVPAPLAPSAAPAPAISITRVATPDALPAGGGRVDFTFMVKNPGNVPLSSVKVLDTRCPTVVYGSGDTNGNARLDPGETWRYTCGGRLTATIADSATASAVYGSVFVRDSDQVTIPVGLKRPALHLETSVGPSAIPPGGGRATFSYVVTNVGNVTVAGLSVVDSACAPVRYVSGDANQNQRLERSETWRYACATSIGATTTARARVSGNVGGSGLHDDATELVTVPKLVPAIHVVAAASPSSLPARGGTVTYAYTVTNAGNVSLADVGVTAATCPDPTLAGGDTNGNARLDLTESWRYTCSAKVLISVTGAVTATGRGASVTVSNIATTAVAVAAPVTRNPAVALSYRADPGRLPVGGGSVVYAYTVTNPGDVPLSDVTVTHDGCQGVRFASGDDNGDEKLDPAETWLFSCLTARFTTTIDHAAATGRYEGQFVTATASATVIVAVPTPSPAPSPTESPTPSPTDAPLPSESASASPGQSGSVAGVTSPPRPSSAPGDIGGGGGGSTSTTLLLLLMLAVGMGAAALIVRLGYRSATR